MNEQEQDKLRQLYRRSRQEQPSVDMDRQIRNAARRALKRSRNRWLWGLSSAAVLLLSFSVVLELFVAEQEETGIYELDLPSSPPPHREGNRTPKIQQDPGREDETQRPLPAAPGAEPVIDFYQALPQRKMELELEKLSDDIAVPREKKSESALRKRSSGVKKPALAEVTAVRKLPHQLAELLKLANGLSGEELASGKVLLYSNNKLILMVEPGTAGFHFKAWQGIETLGVKENWKIRPSSVDGCKDQGAYTSCLLRPGVVGFFEADRLDHVSWIQADE